PACGDDRDDRPGPDVGYRCQERLGKRLVQDGNEQAGHQGSLAASCQKPLLSRNTKLITV
ncbi:MAG: hypothetical protein L0387_05340, partial [Acidobacteria bacterium]|nr:hypothetical protein [Acidobacteriota bacterium]